jgi:prepilin-type processing-associated H-X9-DG protein
MHYAYNAQLNSNRTAFKISNPVRDVPRVTAVRNLGGLPVMIDIVFQNNFYGGTGDAFSTNPPASSGEAFAARHNGGGNILWGDGRVTQMSRQEWAMAPEERVKTGTLLSKRYTFCMGDY